ncbi:MAG: ATP-dependent Clp protease proteolytic subunit [Candidatus Dojkabacteria bacterium]|nr:ATP-dependent Clp protease proteolytic subunit [Candidatus Dojkabacteria bacterium]
MKQNKYIKKRNDEDEDDNEIEIELEESGIANSVDSNNILLLNGEINSENANKTCQILLEFQYKNERDGVFRPIHLLINSQGGSIIDAWQICDIMDIIHYPIITIGLGEIASAALLIFINGEKGFRILSHRASLMSHQYSWGISGKMDDLISASREFNNIYKRMEDHFYEKTKIKRDIIRQKLLSGLDYWMTPKEAVKYNIADHVFNFKKKKPLFFIESKKEWKKIKKEFLKKEK